MHLEFKQLTNIKKKVPGLWGLKLKTKNRRVCFEWENRKAG